LKDLWRLRIRGEKPDPENDVREAKLFFSIGQMRSPDDVL